MIRASCIFGLRARDSALVARMLRMFAASDVQLRVSDVPGDADVALIFGGDGTIHRQLEMLVQRDTPMLTVPIGSGNDFAGSLGIKSVEEALPIWQRFLSVRDNVREVDTLIVSAADGRPRRYCNVGGAGLDSLTNQIANGMPAWLRSNGGYVLASLKAMATFRPQKMRLRLFGGEHNGQVIEERAWFVAVGNAKAYGGGMQITPRAVLDDGLLDVTLVCECSRLYLLRKFSQLFAGTHLALPEVKAARARTIEIEAEAALPFFADGEHIANLPARIEAAPRTLRVLVPVSE